MENGALDCGSLTSCTTLVDTLRACSGTNLSPPQAFKISSSVKKLEKLIGTRISKQIGHSGIDSIGIITV